MTQNEGQHDSGAEQEVPLGEYDVLARLDVSEFWDGEKWVADFFAAKKYPCAVEGAFEEAERDRDRLWAAGTPCGIIYFPPPRKRPRPH